MKRTEVHAHGEATDDYLRDIGADGRFGWTGQPCICIPKAMERDLGHIWKSFALPLYGAETKEEILKMIEGDTTSNTMHLGWDPGEPAQVSSFRDK